MENSKKKASSCTSDTDSTDSYAVINGDLTASDDYDASDEIDKSKTITPFTRNNRSVPSSIRNNNNSSNSTSRHYLPFLNRRTSAAHSASLKNKKQSNPFELQTTYIPNQDEESFNKNDLIVSSLKSTFADVLVPFSGLPDDHLVSKIQGLFDTRENDIDVLEKTLQAKKMQLHKLKAHRTQEDKDDKDALPLLLAKYPIAMNHYRKRIEDDEYKQEYDICELEFELEKKTIINEHKRNYKQQKAKYGEDFKKESDRIKNQRKRRGQHT